MAESNRLYDLFLALFDTDAELRRFLVVQGLPVAELLQPSKVASRSDTAYQAATALDSKGLIDRKLMVALERRAPERKDDVRAVARFYGIDLDAPDPETATDAEPPGAGAEPEATGAEPDDQAASAAVPPEYADYVKRLNAAMDAVEAPPDPSELVLAPERWPWSAAAAVLGSFRPGELHPITDGAEPALGAVAALAGLVFEAADGSWVLLDDPRAAAMRHLEETGTWERALAANEHLPDTRRDLVRGLRAGDEPVLATLEARQLDDLDAVVGWLEPLGLSLPVDRTAIAAAIERRAIIDPLRALVGKHFQGRAAELARVHAHLAGAGDATTLLIQGPGGSGKSTLIGKVLLDLEERAASDPISYAYIDFDKARHDPRDERGLLEQVSRQLRLLYATRQGDAERFASLESSFAGTDVAAAAALLEIPEGLDLGGLVAELSKRLMEVSASGPSGIPPLVLVFDTFEEVQTRGPGAVHDALDIVERLRSAMPGLRVIVSGRSLVPELGPEVTAAAIRLGDLDEAAADALLASRGIGSPDVRALITGRFGRNPLTLNLAAEALRRTGRPDEAFEGVVAQAGALAEVALGQVQGMLYSRILGHIADPEIARMAHPGLVVRRVTVDVIREVLAVPCGLDPARAPTIFEHLRTQVTLFDAEGADALRHRQDVRRLMLAAMANDPARRFPVHEIHDRAVAFYGGREDSTSRAEELYHRLMRGDDPRGLDALWKAAPQDSLASALEEPIPDPARRWLERRLGMAPIDDRGEWDQDDWEASAAREAASWLASRAPGRALEVLAGRTDRLPGSPLFALEVAARLATDDVPGAASALEAGFRSAGSTAEPAVLLELGVQAIEVRVRQRDLDALLDATASAARLCDLAGQPGRAVDLLSRGIDAARALAPDTAVPRLAALEADLSSRFGRLSRDDMRAQPETARAALRSIGSTDSGVLLHAALQVGDRTNATTEVFRDDPLALERLLSHASDGAQPSLDALAREVGLAEPGWTHQQLASNAVQYGRVGQTIAVVLEHTDDEAGARQVVADDLIVRQAFTTTA